MIKRQSETFITYTQTREVEDYVGYTKARKLVKVACQRVTRDVEKQFAKRQKN